MCQCHKQMRITKLIDKDLAQEWSSDFPLYAVHLPSYQYDLNTTSGTPQAIIPNSVGHTNPAMTAQLHSHLSGSRHSIFYHTWKFILRYRLRENGSWSRFRRFQILIGWMLLVHGQDLLLYSNVKVSQPVNLFNQKLPWLRILASINFNQ